MMTTRKVQFKTLSPLKLVSVLLLGAFMSGPMAIAEHLGDDADHDGLQPRHDPHEALMRHDRMRTKMERLGLSAKEHAYTGPSLELVGRGERLLPNATTDVWAHKKFAYIGTFNQPCGDGTGDNGSGVRIFDVKNPKKGVTEVAHIPSVLGSRSNDVKVAKLHGRNILVHSNEPCAGGPGGFEIWDVDDPLNPAHLSSVSIDELNPISDFLFGGITDVGVHNLWLFTRKGRSYVGVVAETAFDNFMIFDITDPTSPSLASAWGAEELFDPGVGDLTDLGDPDSVGRVLDAALWLLDGFGASQNRFLHDITIDKRGRRAYLSNWDAGLVLLDISDPTDPTLVSVALDPENGSLDGEVNSHAAWPSEDGTIVVETEEDFNAFQLNFEISGVGEFPAAEGSFTVPIITLPDREMSGPTTYVGFACTPPNAGFDDPVPAGTGIAVIQRGACNFDEKAQNVIDAGYDGMVVFNDAARGDALVVMGGDPRNIPGIFVGHSTGLAIFNVASADELVIGASGAGVSATAMPEAWGGVRIWNYADPFNPVLIATYHTVCSANPGDPSCDPRGTYSVHNVVVEEERVYISWYSDGVLVLDISNPFNPVEIARFNPTGPEFEASNGGIQDVWGIFKEEKKDLIYASDRNGGLYILDD